MQSDGCNLLINAGNLATAAQLQSKLTDYGVNHLNHLIVTHPHLDHFGGVFAFPADFEIRQVHDNGTNNFEWVYFDHYLQWRANFEYSPLQKGAHLRCGSAEVAVIHRQSDELDSLGLNAGSMVLWVAMENQRFLLAADIPQAIEKQLLEEEHLLARFASTQVLKVSHHGSDAAASKPWLDNLNTKRAVISVGKGNRWNRPYSLP